MICESSSFFEQEMVKLNKTTASSWRILGAFQAWSCSTTNRCMEVIIFCHCLDERLRNSSIVSMLYNNWQLNICANNNKHFYRDSEVSIFSTVGASHPTSYHLLFVLVFFFSEKFTNAEYQTHCNTQWAYTKTEKCKYYFFVPGLVCRNNWATYSVPIKFFNAPNIDWLFHLNWF